MPVDERLYMKQSSQVEGRVVGGSVLMVPNVLIVASGESGRWEIDFIQPSTQLSFSLSATGLMRSYYLYDIRSLRDDLF